MKTGVLLINLGTPDAPRVPEVRRFLREFLSDPGVLGLAPIPRWLLVNLVILPTRPKKSAEAYAAIWSEEGSPLMVYSRELQERLKPLLEGKTVSLAMRYGTPSIEQGFEELWEAGCERVIAMPLFPQFSGATFGSILERIREVSRAHWQPNDIAIVPPFHSDPGFLSSFAEVGRGALDESQPDHVLFSFHGLPESFIRDADPSGTHCLATRDCCAEITEVNSSCYRAHCMATARGIASRLELEPEKWSVSFQSRLGKTPWLGPYTDQVVVELANQGVRKLAVYCPSFVADCLETLEEIGLRAAEDFRSAGGETLDMIPSLNATRPWVEAVAALVQATEADWASLQDCKL